MSTLANRVAIVTGAGQGIGRAEALLLAQEGAAVVVNDYDAAAAKQVALEIVNAGGKAVADGANVGDWSAAEAMVQKAVDSFGGLDILVCNAGIVRDRMLFNMSQAEWDAVMDVHLRGHFAPLHFAARHWRARAKNGEQNHARVIFTSSEAGLFGNPGQANYSAAKAGIIGLCFDAAKELASAGVTVNVIAPRGRTPMTESSFGEFRQLAEGEFDEWDPANVAPFVGFLAGDHAADVTGQVFIVYGGTVQRLAPWPVHTEIAQNAQWTVEGLAAARSTLFPEGAALPPQLKAEIPLAGA